MKPRMHDEGNDAATLVIGLGTPHGDDAVGLVLGQQLEAWAANQGRTWVRVRVLPTPLGILDSLDSLDSSDRFARLIVLDACVSERPIGHLARSSWPHDAWETARCTGSHDLALPDVLKLAGQLGRLPRSITILGITIAPPSSAAGFGLSATLHAAMPGLLRQVRCEIMRDNSVAVARTSVGSTFENGSQTQYYGDG